MRDRERFSPAQCRAARGLLGWVAEGLADLLSVEPETIELYEQGEGDLSPSELSALGAVFNSAGVIALAEGHAGEGVRFRLPPPLMSRTAFAPGAGAKRSSDLRRARVG